MRPVITSVQNPSVKAAARLHDSRDRRQTGLFLVETWRDLTRGLAAGCEALIVYACQEVLARSEADGQATPTDLAQLQANLEAASASAAGGVQPVARSVLEKLAYRQSPSGLVAVMRQRSHDLAGWRAALAGVSAPLVLVMAGIEKPGNVGAILRSADAAGAAGAVVADGVSDLYNPNVIRSSTGALFSLPIALATAEDTLAALREMGMTIRAASPHAGRSYDQVDLTTATALVVGAEDRGLGAAWLTAGEPVRIPMAGVSTDSLNASVAAGVLLFEASRQRGFPDRPVAAGLAGRCR